MLAYQAIIPPSNIQLPVINYDDKEELTRLCLAVVLSGDFIAFGSAVGVYYAICGMVEYLGVRSLTEVRGVGRSELETAIWTTLRAVPERQVSECRKIILGFLKTLADGDLREARDADSGYVREYVERLAPHEPTVGNYLLKILGHPNSRVTPTSGAALLLTRLSVVEPFQPEFFMSSGYDALREEARRALERYPLDIACMSEWHGVHRCPECCTSCCAQQVCPALVEGLV